jgi:hypothetical protein
MINCPECDGKNPNRMVYCGLCRARLKPISPRLREDILFITRQQTKWLTAKLVAGGLSVIGVLSFWGYSQLKQVLLDSAQKDLVPRIVKSTEPLIKSTVDTAVNEAAKATLPHFRSAVRQVQRKHETEVAKATQQSTDEIREAAALAKQQINDATQKTVTQISTTTTWTGPNGRSLQSISSATGPYLADILNSNADPLRTVNVTDSLRLVADLKISKTIADLTTVSLSNASEGCLGIISGTEIATDSQRSNCSKEIPVTLPSLKSLGSGINEPLPALPTLNTKY